MGSILYLGDTSLASAAGYLAGMMHSWNWPYEYVPSDRDATAEGLARGHSLYVFSDYPASRIAPSLQEQIVANVARGAGLLMIGGWESFQAPGGNWASSPLAAALPITMQESDDRFNYDQPILARVAVDHPIVRGLPWRERPPCIGGFNQISPTRGGEVVIEAQPFRVSADDEFAFVKYGSPAPLLVIGSHGAGRSAAFATDVAPHWVGPLVDWGSGRVVARAPGADVVEVGNCYAQFLRQLLSWVGRLEEQPS